MDYLQESFDRINSWRQSKIFTDLHLKISDGKNILEIDVHKSHMAFSSPFFAKSLIFAENYDEKTRTLDVEDAFATYDLILKFYGVDSNSGAYGKWQHALAMAKARRFFLLEMVMPIIPKDLKIEEAEYDDFLELCGLVEIDDDVLEVVAKNMPIDYDLDRLSPTFMQKIIANGTFPIIAYINTKIAYIENMLNGKRILDFSGHAKPIDLMLISSNNLYIATVSFERVNIWNAQGVLVYTFSVDTNTFTMNSACAKFTNDSTCFTIIVSKKRIVTHDFIQGVELYDIDAQSIITDITYSPNDQFLMASRSRSGVKIFNTSNEKCVLEKTLSFDIVFSTIIFTEKYLAMGKSSEEIRIWSYGKFEEVGLDKKFIEISLSEVNYGVVRDDNEIEVWDLDKNILVNKFPSMIDYANYTLIKFSPDNKYIITLTIVDNEYVCNIWNIVSGTLHKSFDKCASIVISPQMKYIVAIQENSTLIYNFDGSIHNSIKEIHNLYHISFVSDDKYLVYGSKQYKVFDIEQSSNVSMVNTFGHNYDKLLGQSILTKTASRLSTYLSNQ